jgi:hypothetical protein
MSEYPDGGDGRHGALTPFAAPPPPAFAETPADEPSAPPAPPPDEWTIPLSVGVMQLAGLASIGAGAIHAGVVGSHSEFPTLARLFVVTAVAQLAVGLLALVKGGRLSALLTIVVNGVAVGAWAVTRLWNIDWESAGLTAREPAEFTDTTCAVLGGIAVVAAAVAVVAGRTSVRKVRLGVPGLAIGAVVVVAMLVSTNSAHTHDAVAAGDDHSHTDEATPAEAVSVDTAAWPRAWDPADGVDVPGVPGVTREQELRAAGLINRTLAELPRFADVADLPALGYRSIEDDRTGYEHFINYSYIGDDKFLDPTAPESLVYRVDGDERTLVSAMYIADDMPIDSPELVDYGGPLMQWHVHENLCWVSDGDGLRVVGVTDANGNCAEGTFNAGGGNPMVHVWIAPHECGPFAALEGHGAGQVADGAGDRVDQCAHDSGHDHSADIESSTAVDVEPVAVPFDPALPIDLSGTPGVTPQQQAFAENLIANTLTDLPQWADPEVAEAAGFRSIRDGATGHEHFINWDWINDDVFLDPDYPESLVYEPQPDGTRKLVSAMYMLPDSYTLDDVPDWGGALMQWHIHGNLCFVTSGDAPHVGGLTDANGECTAPLEKLGQSPMIHVWLTPTPCGPFAALEGVGAGQVAEGEEHMCDHAHGSG